MKNEYVCVEIAEADAFIKKIEELESRDFATMSAGRADNGRWFAILRRDAHAQKTPEAPKYKETELLEAAAKLADYCERNDGTCWDADGNKCPLFSEGMMRCRAACVNRNDSAPRYWGIRKEDGNV